MTSLIHQTLTEALTGLDAGDFTARELTEAHLEAIGAAGQLNAYVIDTADKALEMADASDARRKADEAGLIDGAPIAVKDLFGTVGARTAAASKILGEYDPPYESTITANLWKAGGVMIGKVNMDEFAMGSSNEHSRYGPVVSPWRREGEDTPLVPGGSSGGSAAAVAADLCLGAPGTDTGGSIRQPAAFTGIVGVKPTYGLCSRYGVVAFASSLDHPGPLGKTVEDTAILLRAMAGHDPNDSTSLDVAIPDYTQALGKSLKGLKIGIPKEYVVDGMPEEIARLWDQGADWLKDAGAEIVPVSLPHTQYALPAYYIVAPAEASSNLARYDGMRYGERVEGDGLIPTYEATRAEGFGDEVQRRILIGTYVLSAGYYDAYYLRAQKVRTRILEDFRAAFDQVDVLLTPSTPSAAFGHGERDGDPIQMYLNDIFTVTANLAGVPAISVPAGLDGQGLPLGLQLIAPALGEETMFTAASALEKAAGFTAKPDRWWEG